MKITILGCSGSLGAPGNPASGYLVEDADTRIMMDMGPGVLASAQDIINPSSAHVMFSHLHADHCLDFPSLLVWRRFHPTQAATTRHQCLGPSYTNEHLGRLSAEGPEVINDMADTLAFTPWTLHTPHAIDTLTVTPYQAIHPVEAYILRVADQQGRTLVYSGDTGWTDELIEAARDADVLMSEATWVTNDDVPAEMHLSGYEAGRAAREAGVGKLVLVHIPPWADKEAAAEAARSEFDGPIEIGYKGMSFEV